MKTEIRMLSLALAVTALMTTAAILPMLSIQSVSASQQSGPCPGRAIADGESIRCPTKDKKDTGKLHADVIKNCRTSSDKCSSSNTNFGETVGNDD